MIWQYEKWNTGRALPVPRKEKTYTGIWTSFTFDAKEKKTQSERHTDSGWLFNHLRMYTHPHMCLWWWQHPHWLWLLCCFRGSGFWWGFTSQSCIFGAGLFCSLIDFTMSKRKHEVVFEALHFVVLSPARFLYIRLCIYKATVVFLSHFLLWNSSNLNIEADFFSSTTTKINITIKLS